MNFADGFALWAGGLVLTGLVGHFLVQQFSPEARARRHRRRNYGKVIAKSRRPCVTLSVRLPSR